MSSVNPVTPFDGPNSYVGRILSRPGARRAVRGRGRYTDDISLPRTVHAAFVRSPYGHARIVSIDTGAAAAHPGVVRAMTGAELAEHCPPWSGMLTSFDGMKAAEQHAMAVDRACWQGEPVAVVCARTRAEAEDAAELVEVEWEELPVVIDKERALGPGATILHPDLGDNLAWRRDIDTGNVDSAFAAEGAVTVEETYGFGRHTAGQPGAARAARRLGRGDGEAHRLHLQPGAAHDQDGVRAASAGRRAQYPHRRARCRRLVRAQDPHLRRRGRGLRARDPAEPAGQVRGRPPGVLRHRHPCAGEPDPGADGGRPGRRDHRARNRRSVGSRRLFAVSAHKRLRGQPDSQHRRRALQARELPGGRANCLPECRADIAVSRGRPSDRHFGERGAARSGGRQNRHGPGRAPPPQRHGRRQLSAQDGIRRARAGSVAPGLSGTARRADRIRPSARRAGAAARGRHFPAASASARSSRGRRPGPRAITAPARRRSPRRTPAR